MKTVIALSALLAIAIAAVPDSRNAQIVRYENDNIGVDGYKFNFETSDGTARQEQAEVKNVNSENPAINVRGTVSWIADDGQQYTLTYTADEFGFHPEGAHLPRA